MGYKTSCIKPHEQNWTTNWTRCSWICNEFFQLLYINSIKIVMQYDITEIFVLFVEFYLNKNHVKKLVFSWRNKRRTHVLYWEIKQEGISRTREKCQSRCVVQSERGVYHSYFRIVFISVFFFGLQWWFKIIELEAASVKHSSAYLSLSCRVEPSVDMTFSSFNNACFLWYK